MLDRKGWKALGYASWEEYGEKEWEFSVRQLNRLATAEVTQSVLGPIGPKEILARAEAAEIDHAVLRQDSLTLNRCVYHARLRCQQFRHKKAGVTRPVLIFYG
jgi:hypothetical protein